MKRTQNVLLILLTLMTTVFVGCQKDELTEKELTVTPPRTAVGTPPDFTPDPEFSLKIAFIANEAGTNTPRLILDEQWAWFQDEPTSSIVTNDWWHCISIENTDENQGSWWWSYGFDTYVWLDQFLPDPSFIGEDIQSFWSKFTYDPDYAYKWGYFGKANVIWE